MRTKMIMKFQKDLTNQPVTYELVKKFDLRVNILKADINDNLQGYVVVDIDGHSKNLAEAIKYLEALGVDADLITNTIEIDRNLCVSCGLCTGACGVRALTFSRDTWSLVYVENRCVGCNRCLGACPTRAIKNLVW